MKTRPLELVLVLIPLAVIAPRAATAEEPSAFGERHQVVLSAPNVFGYSHTETRGYRTAYAAFYGSESSSFGLTATPALALDFLVTRHLSLGTGLSIFRSTTQAVAPAGVTPPPVSGFSGEERVTTFTLAPRVGAVVELGHAVGLWPQVGLFFSGQSQNVVGAGSTTDYGVSAQVPVLAILRPRFFATLTPAARLSLGGSTSAGSSTEARLSAYSLEAGMGAYF